MKEELPEPVPSRSRPSRVSSSKDCSSRSHALASSAAALTSQAPVRSLSKRPRPFSHHKIFTLREESPTRQKVDHGVEEIVVDISSGEEWEEARNQIPASPRLGPDGEVLEDPYI